jgi:hypothetical protein
MNVNEIARVTIQGEGQQSLDSLAASVDGVAKATTRLTSATQATATVTELATRRQLSVADAYHRQSLAIDPLLRQHEQLARQIAISNAAFNQGLLGDVNSAQAKAALAQRVGELNKKYSDTVDVFGQIKLGIISVLGLEGLFERMFVRMAVLMAAREIIGFGKTVFDQAAALKDQAEQAGVSVEAFQAYTATMRTSGLSTEEANTVMTKLTRSIGEAKDKIGPARSAFHDLGLGTIALGESFEVSMPKVAQALLLIPDATERARLEVQLFGRQGQEMESSLRALIDPSTTLIEKQKALGQVMSEDVVDGAHKAEIAMTQSWNALKVSAAPAVIWLTDQLTNIIKLQRAVAMGAGTPGASGGVMGMPANLTNVDAAPRAGFNNFGSSSTAYKPANGNTPDGFGAAEWADYLAKLDQEARLTGLSARERAAENEAIKASVKYQELQGVESSKVNSTYEYAKQHLDQQTLSHVRNLGLLSEENKTAGQISETEKLRIELNKQIAAIAESTNKQAATAMEKAAVIRANDAVKGEQEYAKRQSATDAYILGLQNEVKLAGLSGDERAREAAVMQAMHLNGGVLTDDIKNQVTSLVAARQETEKWRQVVDNITSGFDSFFQNVLENGKLSFGDLFRSIEASFAQMLAQMAAQALVQPIIVPMVQQLAGSSAGLGGGAGGLLSAGGPLGGMGGIGSSLSAGAAGLGTALGFGTSVADIPAFTIPGFGLAGGGTSAATSIGASSVVAPGSLFGTTTLGGFMGGVGIGSMAGSLAFGNKNDASTGSLIGSAAGAAIGSVLLPGIGTYIGGLLGGLAGGGLGSMSGSSNHGAITNFTNGGLGSTLFSGSGANATASASAANTISQTIKTLQDAGVKVSLGNVTGLNVGSDKSYVYTSDGSKQKLGGGDVAAVVKAVLDNILPSATGTDDTTNSIVQKYKDQGGINSGNISQLAQDIQAAQASKAQADQAAADLKAQVDAFGPALSASLKAIQDPIGAQYDALIASQKARLTQAQQLGVNVSQLDGLNSVELNKFLSGLNLTQLNGLSKSFDVTATAAYAAAQAQADLAAAQTQAAQEATAAATAVNQARSNLVASYNTEKQTLQSTVTKYQTLTDSLRGYLGQMGGASSNPTAQYGIAQAVFSATAAQARSSDYAAQLRLQQASQDFLTASQAASQTLMDYSRDRAAVVNAVGNTADMAQATVDASNRQLDALDAQVSGLIDVKTAVLSVGDAVAAMQDALATQAQLTAANTKKIADLLTRVTQDGNALQTVAA